VQLNKRPSRRLGIEPCGVDLTICSRPLTAADRAEMSAFLRRKRAENDRKPWVVALRRHLAQKKAQGPALISPFGE
jgi:hypothetical protein